jgi:glycosyltransferase involved in cell wall biosynthesis
VIYSPAAVANLPGTPNFTARLVAGRGNAWWEQVQLSRAANRDRLDVFFGPGYSTPLRLAAPTVVAIHDVSFFAHPEWFRPREGLRRRWITRLAASHAGAIVTISNFSRSEIAHNLGVLEDRIHVIPPGVSDVTVEATATDTRDGNSVLFVGSIFTRRRVGDLIRAFGRVVRRRTDQTGFRLDVVGDNRSYPFEDLEAVIADEGMAQHIRLHPFVSDDQLLRFFRQARAFAFLSEYEGLGLTPLEALASGVPPVLLDTAIARESCGEAALYVPTGDLSATADALELALFDDETRRRVLSAATGVLARYSWPRAARETLAVIENAAANGTPRAAHVAERE